MDAVYNALDTFSRASLLASGVDTELEAISEAWLGKIQYKLLTQPLKAKRHLYECMLLVDSFYPKVVSGQAWFELAKKHLQEIRDKLFAEDQAKQKSENQKYYTMIEKDLSECREKKK